jgi:hypothetical protein
MPAYVFIDESGNLAKSGGATKYLILASVATDRPRQLDKAVKKIWRAKPRVHESGELHAYDADEATRRKFLRALTTLEIQVHVSVTKKSSAKCDLHTQYYVMIAQEIRRAQNAYRIVADKRDTVRKRRQMLEKAGLESLFRRVEFADSKAVKPLQAADFVSWAAFQKYEHGDNSYFDIIESKVKDAE